MKLSIKMSSFFEYVIALAIILDCNSVWNNLIETRVWFQYLILALLFTGVIGFIASHVCLSRKAFFFNIVVIPVYYILYYIINGNSIIQTTLNLMIACSLLGIYYMSQKSDTKAKKLLICFKNIVVCIAAISIFFWITGSLMGIVQPTGISLTNWTGNANQTSIKSYYGIYYSYQNIWFFDKIHIVRNIAIFNEAPMASLVFSLGLMIELLCCKVPKKFNCIVLFVAIISTFSTSGYIIAAIVYSYNYIKRNSRDSIIKRLKVLFVPLLFFIVIIVGIILIREKLSTFSGMARIDDFISGVRAWLLNPIIGDGIGSLKAMSIVRPSWRQNAEGFNSGIIQVLVQGGIYLAFPYIFIVLRSIKVGIKLRKFDQCVFSILFAFIFCITVIAFNYLTLMIMWFLTVNFKNSNRGDQHSNECGNNYIPCSL